MKFDDLDISSEIKTAVKNMNYEVATEVQIKSIKWMLEGHNVIVRSHTGSGKTTAFGLPISENIFKGKSKSTLILCPTRELAVQVKAELAKINQKTGLRTIVVYGGHGMTGEIRDLQRGVDILCATPGRLLDHFRNNHIDPKQFDTVILDEADRMLDMGFIHDLRQILDFVKPKSTHLFSATLEGSIANLIQEYIPTYEEIILPDEIVGKDIIERHIKVPRELRFDALLEVITEAEGGKVLIFVSTKRTADFLSKKLYRHGLKVEAIHGDKSQNTRQFALDKFRDGKCRILVATDVASRGIQVDDIEFVVNYDLANDYDTHMHRIGRTGRMGDKGEAVTFVGENGSIIEPRQYNRRQASSSNGRNASFAERNAMPGQRRGRSGGGRSQGNFRNNNRPGKRNRGPKRNNQRIRNPSSRR